jgi:hypothetical protein
MNFQHVYTSYLVVRGAGLIEVAVRDILQSYATRRGSPELSKFVVAMVARENSLSCEKLERIFGRFSPDWWGGIRAVTTEPERSAVDSLKTLRDQFAHGQANGTGFAIVENYYNLTKVFILKISNHINPD